MGRQDLKEQLRSYVVRVYRHTRTDVAGQVEDVESGLIRPFRSSEELWSAIGGTLHTTTRTRRR